MKSDLFYTVEFMYSMYKQGKFTQEEHLRNVEKFFEWLGMDIKSMPFHPFYTEEGKKLKEELEEKVKKALVDKLGSNQDVEDVLRFLLCVITDGHSEIFVRFSNALIMLYIAEEKDRIKEYLAGRYEKCSKATSAVNVEYIQKNIDKVLHGIEVIGNVAYLAIDRYLNNRQELEKDLERLREEIKIKLAEKKSPQSPRGIPEKSSVSLLVLVGLIVLLLLILVALLVYLQSQPEQPPVQPQELKGK